jgi:hypothetical protein
MNKGGNTNNEDLVDYLERKLEEIEKKLHNT